MFCFFVSFFIVLFGKIVIEIYQDYNPRSIEFQIEKFRIKYDKKLTRALRKDNAQFSKVIDEMDREWQKINNKPKL